MADKKISQLSSASTPLAGTEVLPIVQSSATVKVATDDLTVKNIRSNATTGILQIAGPGAAATRTMTVPDANFTAARTDAAQTFTGDQTVSGVVAGTRFTSGTSSFVSNPATAVFGFYSGGGTPQTYIQMPLNGSIAFWGPTTAERAKLDSAGNFSLNAGNLVMGTAGKGIDFSANANAPGMTSELLTWYEEGTWTPVITSTSGTITSYTVNTATYTRIGRVVHIVLQFAITNNGTGAGALTIAGLPFAATAATCGMTYNQSTGEAGTFTVDTSATSGSSVKYNNAYPVATGQTLQFNLTYSV